MLEAITGILGSAAAGGITGVIGTALGAWAKAADDKRQFAHKEQMRKIDLREMAIESRLRRQEAEVKYAAEQEIRVSEERQAGEKQSVNLRMASYAHDAAKYGRHVLGRIVDFVRGLMRPAITAFVLWMFFSLYLEMSGLVGGMEVLPMEAIVALYEKVVNGIIYLAISVTTWWFGDRATDKLMSRKK